jgi:phosphoglycerol transferase MdoB-like AlkP superfamily enzyme
MKKWTNLAIILKTYALVISIFFLFRLILFFTELNRIDSFSADFQNIILAFFMGIRFDIVISGYILALPFLVLSIMFILDKHIKLIYNVLFYWIFVLFTIAFIVCGADIPYFKQFFSRFSVAAFQWMDSPLFVLKMIFEEPRYFVVIIPLVLILIIFFVILRKIFRIKEEEDRIKVHFSLKILVSLLILGLIFIGIRGRLAEKSPIRVGTAFFCDNAFLNQLGLNPVFTLMRSYFDSLDKANEKVAFMDDQAAVDKVRKYLDIKPIDDYPVARQVLSDSTGEKRYNVILVIMESMSAAKMGRYGNPKNLTPFLDSISTKGYNFENIYSAGIHTFNGVFSTLFSFPGIYLQHPMKESSMFKYNGIGNTLLKNGYTTAYFTTHDGQFDNIEGFLKNNDFEYVITLADYPSGIAHTTLGVPDDYMFEYSMPLLDQFSLEGKPFFAAFMTASDHGPFYLPSYYNPRSKDIRDQMVEYADWSLKKLVTLASKKDWFANTVFVFVADHGAPINAVYDIPLDYHHSPLIFYAPDIIKDPVNYDVMGGQIDVFPTIMGILNQDYVNNTLGIDLRKEHRPCIYFNHEDQFGVIDKDFLLILKQDGDKFLYKYQQKDKKDYKDEYPDMVNMMTDYALSNIQVFQFLMQSDKRFYKK